MVKIYIRDNEDGRIHEYGTNHHDSLVVIDGHLEYLNQQNMCGTQGGTYSFCKVDGTIPRDYEELDMGGEYWNDAECLRLENEKAEKLSDKLKPMFAEEFPDEDFDDDEITIIS